MSEEEKKEKIEMKIYKYPFKELIELVEKEGPIEILFKGTDDSPFLPKEWRRGRLGKVKFSGPFWARGDYIIEEYVGGQLVGYRPFPLRNIVIKLLKVDEKSKEKLEKALAD
jgi:hypothetical protein